jgi:hypothetical protein
MRLALKLSVTGMMALAFLSLTAVTASAQVEVLEEDGGHCPPVTIVVHTVSGGCDVEYRSERHLQLVAYVPSPVIVSNCNLHFRALIGENGIGYVTAAVLSSETNPPTSPACTRAPCDENGPIGASAMLPWPIHIEENIPDQESIELEFCHRTTASGEGGAGTRCHMHLPFKQYVSHDHEIAGNEEYFCEVAPFPTSYRNVHFINEVPAQQSTADIEIIH